MPSQSKRRRLGRNEISEHDFEAAPAFILPPINTTNPNHHNSVGASEPIFFNEAETHPGPQKAAEPAPSDNPHDYSQPDYDMGGAPMEDDGLPPPRTRRQRDYLQEFLNRTPQLLEALLNRETHEKTTLCFNACGRRARWRCRDCTMAVPLCRGCMRRTHLRNPLHRIECWTGNYFRRAEMWEVGGYLMISHQPGLRLCKTLAFYVEQMEEMESENDDNEERDIGKGWPAKERNAFGMEQQSQEDNEATGQFNERIDEILEEDENDEMENEEDILLQDPFHLTADAEEEMVDDADKYWDPAETPEMKSSKLCFKSVRIVHMNGIHHLPLLACLCEGHDQIALDLMHSRLVVTSFKTHRTLFTADLLDYFRLLNLELKGSAYQFFLLLRRLTRPLSPAEVANLYHELRRLTRFWRYLKKLKWAGKASGVDVSGPGALAPFCPACPQPDRNLPANWEQDAKRWIYRRYVVIDGNFKADHVRSKHPATDLWLSNGTGMMPNVEEYAEFLKNATETRTKAPCENSFRAIEKAMLASKACDVTGVVAVACARHGCYAPNSLCNLFKGEQQKNADFASGKTILFPSISQDM